VRQPVGGVHARGEFEEDAKRPASLRHAVDDAPARRYRTVAL